MFSVNDTGPSLIYTGLLHCFIDNIPIMHCNKMEQVFHLYTYSILFSHHQMKINTLPWLNF